MKSFKVTIILLVACLALLCSVAPSDKPAESWIFVLAIVGTFMVLFVPPFTRFIQPLLMILVMVGYLAGRLLLGQTASIDGRSAYFLIVQIVLFATFTSLSVRLCGLLNQLGSTLEDFAVAGLKDRIKPLQEGLQEAHTEVNRSRRYSRPLSMIVLKSEPSSSKVPPDNVFVADVQRAMMSQHTFSLIGQTLCRMMRRTDLILMERERGRFIILCPESDSTSTRNLIERIQRILAPRKDLSVWVGASTFPDEFVSFEDMVKEAESRFIPLVEAPAILLPTEKFLRAIDN